MSLRPTLFLLATLLGATASLAQQAPAANALDALSSHHPFEFGPVLQAGNGLTDQRGGFHFVWVGVQAGRVLTNNVGRGPLRGNFELGMQLFPFFQAYTPKFQRVRCSQIPGNTVVECSGPYTVGGTFTGVSVTPVILRWNFARQGRFVPWAQAAGGLLWTNHKFPSYGNTAINLQINGPNGDASVFNFTPQGGIGLHYFTQSNRSVDFSANGTHISSASLGDRNPGVNASVQFTVGYSWWK